MHIIYMRINTYIDAYQKRAADRSQRHQECSHRIPIFVIVHIPDLHIICTGYMCVCVCVCVSEQLRVCMYMRIFMCSS